jgi:hypothetical protein
LFKKLIPLLFLFAGFQVNAAVIDFTGGSVYGNGGALLGVTNDTNLFDDVSYYIEDGFRLDFLHSGGTPDPFGSHVGDYYETGNDVFHAHWDDGPYGDVSEIRISKVGGGLFDLGGFRVSSNTSVGGGPSSGGEIVNVSTSNGLNLFNVASDDWGLGNGPDPLHNFGGNALFEGITWFSFKNDPLSTAVGLGLDNFYFDEAGDPDGSDPTKVAEPTIMALFAAGLFGIRFARRRKV